MAERYGRATAGRMKLPRFTCTRCQHEWIPRTEQPPKVCPSCKSPYWNRERRTPRLTDLL